MLLPPDATLVQTSSGEGKVSRQISEEGRVGRRAA